MAIAFIESVPNADSGTSVSTGSLTNTPLPGDILIICQQIGSTISNVSSNPTGFVAAFEDDNDNSAFCGRILYKIADAGEASSFTTHLSVSQSSQQELIRFSGVDRRTPNRTHNGNDPVGTANSGTPGSITPVTGELLVAMLSQANTNGGSETVGSSYNILDTSGLSKLMVAYIIAPSTTALNPTFNWTTGVGYTGLHAAFSAAAQIALPFQSPKFHRNILRNR